MNCIKMVALIGLFIFSTINIAGQKRELGSREFWILVGAAQDRATIYDRRHTFTNESLENNKLTNNRTYIYEYILPDRTRWMQKIRYGNKDEVTEQIQIGEKTFCRENSVKWEVKNCSQIYSGGGPEYISEKASVENIKIGNENFEYYKLYRTFEINSKLRFSLTEAWVDSLERITKQLRTYGSVETGEISSKELSVYVYNPKDLKIEAPVN